LSICCGLVNEDRRRQADEAKTNSLQTEAGFTCLASCVVQHIISLPAVV